MPMVKLEVFLPSLNGTRTCLIHAAIKKDFEFALPFNVEKKNNLSSELLDDAYFNATINVTGLHINNDTLPEVFMPTVKLGWHSTEVLLLPSLNMTKMCISTRKDFGINLYAIFR